MVQTRQTWTDFERLLIDTTIIPLINNYDFLSCQNYPNNVN